MTENKRPQNDQQPQDTEFAREPLEVQQPQETEFGAETPVQEGLANEQKAMEKKDKRGGNHNPKGANQYTSGRVDDRGRKE